jgi:cellulose synthase/poly-beta-1,6-N-acetylglucosamine synthase-like glycosyltransferase
MTLALSRAGDRLRWSPARCAATATATAYWLVGLPLLAHAGLQLWLLVATRRRSPAPLAPSGDLEPPPTVTVQLPLYNEVNVVEQLLERVAALQYPRDLLEVQVLDDSTDATPHKIAARLPELRAAGLRVHHIRRRQRSDFKAGALAHGLATASGELIAVFDADFLPPPEFLSRIVPHFRDARVGAVQARWDHVNRSQSPLTEIQALMLDAHFAVEQRGRGALGCFMNFNGSAGVWRAAAIDDAGGWSADTLTEDVDLSYRAQLSGWRVVYRDDIVVPAELPGDIFALRIQQFRWMKGMAENARKLLPVLLRSPLPVRVKLHAAGHLLETTVYALVAVQTMLSVPVARSVARRRVPSALVLSPMLVGSFLLLMPVYHAAYRRVYDDSVGRFAVRYLRFVVFCNGLAFHNALAVLAGLAGRRSAFERTPKRGLGAARAGSTSVSSPLEDLRLPYAEALVWLWFGYELRRARHAGHLRLMLLPGIGFAGLTSVLGTMVAQARGRFRPSVASARRRGSWPDRPGGAPARSSRCRTRSARRCARRRSRG